MPIYKEKIDRRFLPVVPLRSIVAFPAIPMSIEISDAAAAGACERADKDDAPVFLITQKDASAEHPVPENFYEVGVVARIKQMLTLPDGSARIIFEGMCRASVLSWSAMTDAQSSVTEGGLSAEVLCKTVIVEDNGGVRGEALVREMVDRYKEYISHMPKASGDLSLAVASIENPGLLADFLACNILGNAEDKQKVLEEFDPLRRCEVLALAMERELEIVKEELKIHKKVCDAMDRNQRDYYLREQLKAIQGELDMEPAEYDGEIEEYREKIASAHLPEEVAEKLNKELKRLAKSPYSSAESSVSRSYLDTCLEIPWKKLSRDRIDLEHAKKILERDHDGLPKIKERIIEYLAVKKLTPDIKGQILCFVGPPGTGKTSIVRSIAAAMNRKYVRVSLGGVRDEADIRGHRKTYIGAMPGRIVTAITQAGVRNPLILLDEIDKLTRDAHGDPSSALLEVLDSEQNKTFRDHFVEMPLDLSDCIFIATANTLETVPAPLIDRMEIIELKTYTRHEKAAIAKNHLIPKQKKRHGISARALKITDEALFELIDFYTAEAGVRNLEREIGNICRKAARRIVEEDLKTVTVDRENVAALLGPRKAIPDRIPDECEVGEVNGLAYTELGGDMLRIEAAVMPGTGKIELTGSLGDVMKESAKAAVTYIRTRTEKLGIDPDFYKNRDLHIHVPEGAVPKDGPSAGITMITALASALSGRAVRREYAMTGEISLRGRVMAIGGLREKTLAAYKAGVKKIFIPADNLKDMEDVDPVVREAIEFIPVKNADEVLERVLLPLPHGENASVLCEDASGVRLPVVDPQKRRTLEVSSENRTAPEFSGSETGEDGSAKDVQRDKQVNA